MNKHFYKLKDNVCYKWIFSQRRKKVIAPKGHPFIIPIEEADCSLCNSCEQ